MDRPETNSAKDLTYSALSDVGLRRANNQDSYSVVLADSEGLWEERGHFFMVADGMGAHAAGELASKMATDAVPHNYHKAQDVEPPDGLRQAIVAANDEIHARGQANSEFLGMGTTCSTLAILPEGAVCGHVGDSRVYRQRGHRLDQLTFDHSLVWEMQASGQIPKGKVPDHIPKNVITRSLGPNAEVKVDLEGPHPIQIGDTFMLCSDGLTGPVTNEEIGTILECLEPEEAVQVLVDLANLRGGPDNITTIVVRVTGPSVAAEDPLDVSAAGTGRVHPGLWAVLALCVVTTAAMGYLSQWLGATLSGIGAIVAGLFVLSQKQAGKPVVATPIYVGPQLGKGPYDPTDCPPGPQMAENLTKIVEELRIAANTQEWTIEWDRFDSFERQAQTATAQQSYPEAVRYYARAISFMMEQIRKQRDKRAGASDSSIDLV
jgi:serine/threonine protein phosphatase PrpC